jgi:hypothetical protein
MCVWPDTALGTREFISHKVAKCESTVVTRSGGLCVSSSALAFLLRLGMTLWTYNLPLVTEALPLLRTPRGPSHPQSQAS